MFAAAVIAMGIAAVAFIVFGNFGRQKVATNGSVQEQPVRERDNSRDHARDFSALQPITSPPAVPKPGTARPTPTTAAARRESAKPPAKTAVKPKLNTPIAAKVDDRPIARQALDLVGSDPIAEAIWNDAINDPSVSAHDRQDLIEDLNENGFDDPAHPSADDLPLIANRIALIEQLAPLAMDETNAAAFAEAYKDLTNMYAKAWRD